MSPKPRRSRVCALCGENGKLTREHFVPKALWSGALPRHVETVPACQKCNGDTNHDDDYFRNVLVTMFDQEHPEKATLIEGKVFRSFEKRPDWLGQMLSDVRVQPMFTPSGICLGHLPTLTLDADRFERSLRKIVKGLYYLIKKRSFPRDGEIAILAHADEDTWDLICFVEQYLSPVFNYGDDVFEWRFFQTHDGVTGWKLAFYRSVVFYALTFDEPIEHGSRI
jgi:hypothetical protein